MPFNLLTPQQVAEQLAIPEDSVRRLQITRVRIGKGRGQLRYRQEDVDRYIRERLEDPRAQSVEPARRGQSRGNTVVFRGLTPRETKASLRVSDKGRGRSQN